MTSTVTPAPGTFMASQGSLAVSVVGADGTGVPGSRSRSPARRRVRLTDANGCAFFGYEPVGGYVVSASRAGWVDTMGRPLLSATVNVASQQISTKELSYDQAGSATALLYFINPTSTWARILFVNPTCSLYRR